MIARGSKVIIDSARGARRVENLRVGEYVHAPLSGKLCQIKKVYQHVLKLNLGSDWKEHQRPVVVPMLALGKQFPSRSVVVSSSQQIMIAKSQAANRYPVCEWVKASNLPNFGISIEEFPYPEIEYFEIFMSESEMIDVEGIICTSRSSKKVRSVY